MNELVQSKQVDEKPEFAIILDDLKNEIMQLEVNAKSIFEKTCKIRDIRKPTISESIKQNMSNENDLIEEFSILIRTFREYNNILDEARIGLTRFIG